MSTRTDLQYCPECSNLKTKGDGYCSPTCAKNAEEHKTAKRINGLTFKEWLAKVGALVSAYSGLGVDDGVDWCSADCWESGGSPKRGLAVWRKAQRGEF